MAGANPARTSSVSEGPGGMLAARWIKPIEPYISQKVQIVASGGVLYLSTAAGLYALDAASGAEKWVYPTAMPLGHSPTVAGGVVYVGGFDRRLHALDAASGALLWTFAAGAGFHANPLVVNDIVYSGNRDGFMYAVDGRSGALVWRYETAGPILFSAAYHEGVIYFASNDGYAYALDAVDGSPVWQSEKLPGLGFHSYWPVVYGDYVVFPGSAAFDGKMHGTERSDLFPNWETDPDGTLVGPLGSEPGDWVAGTPTIDASQTNETGSSTAATDYLAAKPWRRTLVLLNRDTGEEVFFDYASGGLPGYLPALWAGTTGSGNRYPPVVGNDQVLYFRNNYLSDGPIAGGGVTGWKSGSPFLSLPQSREIGGHGDWPVDEPGAYSVGGNYLYHSLCCDRVIGALDLSQPNEWPPPARVSPRADNPRQWRYEAWKLAGYNSALQRYLWRAADSEAGGSLIFAHGDQNAPVPYNGMVYLHRSNAVVALAPGQAGELLPTAATVAAEGNNPARPVAELSRLLAQEVEKIVAAGHLRPGYSPLGLHNVFLDQVEPGLLDYFANPADTLIVLLRTLPHLPPGLQAETRDYIQGEFALYPPQRTSHSGWLEGAPRGPFDLPDLGNGEWGGRQSRMLPQNVYALWKYAEAFGGALELYGAVRDRLPAPPPDDELAWNPQRHNAFIAGYLGYLELEKLAGQPESVAIRTELERLLSLRATTFTADLRYPEPEAAGGRYYYAMLIAWNFMNLTPELADYLHEHARDKVAAAVARYEEMAPYWFVAQAEEMQGEGVLAPLYHYHSLFQARARILREPYETLERYVDVPAFSVGDLFYIDNLVAALEAPGAADGQQEAEADSAPEAAPAAENTRPPTQPTPAVGAAPTAAGPAAEQQAAPAQPLWSWLLGLLLAAALAVLVLWLARSRRSQAQ